MLSKKLYFIAGERSGDLHAASLIRKTRRKTSQRLITRGLGGAFMREQGVTTIVDIKELAVMGFYDILVNIFRIAKILSKCKKDILDFRPDLVFLIDYGGFNLRIAKFCKKKNIPVFFYIPPKVWFWGRKRVYKLKKYVDEVFCIFPFEKQFLENYKVNVSYMGNPLIESINQFQPNPNFLNELGLSRKPVIAILPGSRKNEVARILDELIKVVDKFPDYQFIIAGVDTLPKQLYQIPLKTNVKVVFEKTYDVLNIAYAALVTSGTATLETAIFRVPQVVCYKCSWMAYTFAILISKTTQIPQFFSLVNLLCDKKVVKELLQDQCVEKKIIQSLAPLLKETPERQQVVDEYDKLIRLLGEKKPSEEISSAILQKIKG